MNLVVVAVEMKDRSTYRPAEIAGIELAAQATGARQTGGPIDVVTAQGCEHVLAQPGDEVLPGGNLWLGLTVSVTTCDALKLPVAVSYNGGGGVHEVRIDVPLEADKGPSCPTLEATVGSSRAWTPLLHFVHGQVVGVVRGGKADDPHDVSGMDVDHPAP